MSADQAQLRSLVFPGLLYSARRNLAGAPRRSALFEIAQVVLCPAAASSRISRCGSRACWPATGAGFFDAKGVVETLYGGCALDARSRAVG